MRYFIGTELGVANYLHRHFDWALNLLWPGEIPGFKDGNRCAVFLAGQDAVLNAPRVRRHLLDQGMKEAAEGEDPLSGGSGLIMDWEAAHGESLIESSIYCQLVKRWLERSNPERLGQH